MTLYERLLGIDRRWVFLVLTIFVVGPLFISVKVPMSVSREVRQVYDYVKSLKADDYIVMGFDYDPNALAELEPMAYAILEQCFKQHVKVIALTLSQNGAGMAERSLLQVVDSTRIYDGWTPQYGEDYTFLGYRPYYAIVILGMGRNFRIPFPRDYYGNVLDSLPMMKGINNYDDVKCVIDFTGSNVADAWVAYGNGAYGVKLAMGMTGVQAADYYPYYQSGQLFGIMGGMKGAAEYEYLAAKNKVLPNTGPAIEAMKIQIFAHLVIIAFIALGNLGYFIQGKKRREEKAAAPSHVEPGLRPPSVFIVGWALMILAAIGIITMLGLRPSTVGSHGLASFRYLTVVALAVQFAASYGILRGRKWGRGLFLWLAPVDVLLGLLSGWGLESLLRAACYCALAILLDHRRVLDYFGKNQGPAGSKLEEAK